MRKPKQGVHLPISHIFLVCFLLTGAVTFSCLPDVRQEYYESGQLKAEIPFKDGTGREYYESGGLKAEWPYKDGRRNGIGRVYYRSGGLEKEIPFKDGVQDGIARSYSEDGRLLDEYQVGSFRSERPPVARFQQGVSHAKAGQYELAIEEFEEVVRLKPDWAEAHGHLGNAYAHEGRYDLAKKQFKRAIRIKPDYADA
ncbi:MAG: tetratricopeptide repeat protein, partial [Candidatus Brocadiales bacterium]